MESEYPSPSDSNSTLNSPKRLTNEAVITPYKEQATLIRQALWKASGSRKPKRKGESRSARAYWATQNDLVPLFQKFGFVAKTRFQSDRGFAFIKMDSWNDRDTHGMKGCSSKPGCSELKVFLWKEASIGRFYAGQRIAETPCPIYDSAPALKNCIATSTSPSIGSFTDHVKSKGFNYGFIECDDPGARFTTDSSPRISDSTRATSITGDANPFHLPYF